MNFPGMKWRKNMLPALVILTAAGGLYHLQVRLDTYVHERYRTDFMYLPEVRFLKPFLLGFEHLVADYYWIQTVLYFGENATDAAQPIHWQGIAGSLKAPAVEDWEKPNLGQLSKALNFVTDLDPSFAFPYIFGGIFLSSQAGEVDHAIALLEKGRSWHPTAWQIPWFLGYNHLFYRGDTPAAAREFLNASKLPGCPAQVEDLINGIVTVADKKVLMVQFLRGALDKEADPDMRRRLRSWLEKLTNNSTSEGQPGA